MRALSWFVVLCLVAMSGAGRAGALNERSVAALGRAAPASPHASATSSALHASSPRTRATERPRHAPPPLPPAALPGVWSPPVPPSGWIASQVRVPERVFATLVRTGSARGPPLV